MRYVLLAILVTGSAALTGCFNDDNDNDFEIRDRIDTDVAADQAAALLAVKKVSAVIKASNNVNTDEPIDIDRIILPDANLAEPIKITGANASL